MWSICTNPGSVLLGFLLLTWSQSTQNLEKETQSDLTSNWLQVFFLPFFHPPWKESFQLFLRIRQLTLRFSSPSPEHKAVQWQQRTHSSSELANILSKPSPKTEGEEIQLGLAEVWVSQPPVWIHTSACSGPEALHHKCLRAKPGSREFHTLAWKMIFGLEKQFSFLSKFSFTISSWRKALKKNPKPFLLTQREIFNRNTHLSTHPVFEFPQAFANPTPQVACAKCPQVTKQPESGRGTTPSCEGFPRKPVGEEGHHVFFTRSGTLGSDSFVV